MTVSQPIRASDFLNGIGADTHIPYTDGGYVNLANVIADLKYLGMSQVRDGLSDGAYGSAPLASFIKLAQAGVKFTIVRGGGVTNTADLAAELNLLDRLATAVPGSVVAVEGVNEINNQPVTFNGQGGQAGAVALQRALYSMVHSDPVLAGVAVDYFTGYSEGAGTDPDPSKTPGLADYDTQHPYPRYGEAPAAWVDPQRTLPNEGVTKGPFVYTETGYSTYGAGSVSETVQAKYTLDLLLDAAKDGATKTYLYQLMDAYAPGSRQGDDGFGLFGPGNVAKPAAVALHNLTTILADTGTAAASFTPSAVSYTLAGLPATGNSLAIAKSSGVVDIAVWAEPNIWNATTLKEVAAPTATATMSLGATYATVSVYDPLAGSSATQVLHNVNSLKLALTDHPFIVELGTVTDSPGTLSLGGLTNGNAVAGSALTASVSDPNGAARSVLYTFTDTTTHQTLASGAANSYTVAASLAGDTINVTAAYADAQGFADQAQASAAVAAAPVLVPATASDTLVLALSEDAWKGDAQFTVSVDGVRLGGVQAVQALRGSGQTQAFTFNGQFGAGTHAVTVDFLNDAWGGTATTDRNLYVNAITLDGHKTTLNAAQMSQGAATYTVQALANVAQSPSSGGKLVLSLSEDAWMGNAQFTVSVDGAQVGGVQSVTALHGAGQSQDFSFDGPFGAGFHTVAVNFLNDAWGGTATTDRNLYVKAITLNGHTTTLNAAQMSQGVASYTVQALATTAAAPVASAPTVDGKLLLDLSEDAWKGDAQFTVSVDGTQIGGLQSVTASHSAGQSQTFALTGQFSAGPHQVAVDFVNDAWGGTAATDRNLYVDAITLDGTTVAFNSAQGCQGAVSYNVVASASTDTTTGAQALMADAGATLILDDRTAAAGTPISFGGSGATLQLTTAQSFNGTLASFGAGDTLDLRSIGFAGSTTLGFAGGAESGTLSVSDGTHAAHLAMLGQYGGGNFALASDGHGGTAVSFLAHG